MTVTLGIEKQQNGPGILRILSGDCDGQVALDSEPIAGQGRDYFATCDGSEPEACHMRIQSQAQLQVDQQLPQNFSYRCVGDCEHDEEECEDKSIPYNNTELTLCDCVT